MSPRGRISAHHTGATDGGRRGLDNCEKPHRTDRDSGRDRRHRGDDGGAVAAATDRPAARQHIALAVLALLVSMSTRRVLDFSIFPSYLLIATLFRLALNVSVTRLVLLHGYAGKVIESFGHFVVGGSVVVGLVIFLILIVIQFIVITNGAGRVAEVAARFTLDAMPGKQMAIDADLTPGSSTRPKRTPPQGDRRRSRLLPARWTAHRSS